MNEEIMLDHCTADYQKDIPEVGYLTLSEVLHRGQEGVECVT